MNFKMKIADLVIDMTCQTDALYQYCRDYRAIDERTDIKIIVLQEDIINEMRLSCQIAMDHLLTEHEWAELEILAGLRKIAEVMPLYQRFLMHGTVVSWKEQGYLFVAPSGTGKSTHAALWKKYLGNDVEIINGDKPFIKVDMDNMYVYGAPWAGKERWQKNTSVPLKGICFLQRGRINQLKKIPPSEALPLLMPQVYCTHQPEMAEKVLDMLDVILEKVLMYRLTCDISEEAVKCSFEGMCGG